MATAFFRFIFGESDADVVTGYFGKALQEKKRIFICSVNWAEVAYQVIRRRNLSAWKKIQTGLHTSPLELWKPTPP